VWAKCPTLFVVGEAADGAALLVTFDSVGTGWLSVDAMRAHPNGVDALHSWTALKLAALWRLLMVPCL
jgi:hypothetical protein